MTTTLTYDGTWQQIATGAATLIVSSNITAKLYIGADAPVATSGGFKLGDDYPYTIPNLAAYGGNAWVKGTAGACTYVTG